MKIKFLNKKNILIIALTFTGYNFCAEQEKASREKLNQELIEASFLGKLELVQSLLRQGADVNAKNKAGRTALMEAVLLGSGKMQLIELLLNAGADVNVENDIRRGETAFSIARRYGNKDIINMLNCYKDRYLPYRSKYQEEVGESMPGMHRDLTRIIGEYADISFSDFRKLGKC